MSGRGFVHNLLLVELLEDHDDLDMLLDFGAEYKYRLKAPTITSGKVFISMMFAYENSFWFLR